MKKYLLLTPLFAFFLGIGVVFAVNRFADVPNGHWGEAAIIWNDETGIMQGGGNQFRPNDNITRAEVAVVTQRLYDLISSERGMAAAILDEKIENLELEIDNVRDMKTGEMTEEEDGETSGEEDEMTGDEEGEMDSMEEEGEDDDTGGETTTEDEADVMLSVEARNYEFRVNGESNPEIRVQQGDTVRIELTSTDGTHNWYVDELGVASDTVDMAQTTVIEFTADTAGTFDYYCDIGDHREQGMEGTIIVE